MAKKKEFYEELPTKECPSCGEMCMEDDTVCDNCGYRFTEEALSEEDAIDFDALFGGLEVLGSDTAEEEPLIQEEGLESIEDIESIDSTENVESIAEIDDIEGIMDIDETDIESIEDIDEVEDELALFDGNEESVGEIEEEEEDDILAVVDEGLKCPKCGAEITEDTVHCPSCGYQLKELEETEPTSPLMDIESHYQFAIRSEIDYSTAIPGKETIVRFEGDKCIALMTPFEIPVKVVEVGEEEAAMLKADHQLRCQPELTVKEIVDAGHTLKNSKKYLQKYYGKSDIDDIYGAGISNYANVKTVKEELLKIGLSVEVLEILKELKANEQKMLADILNKLDANELTKASAKCIVDSDRDEITMVDIVGREQMTRYVVNEMLNQRLGQ